MKELKSKLETLENIAKSENILATEKFCIFSTILPKDIERDLFNQFIGAVNFAESLVNKEYNYESRC